MSETPTKARMQPEPVSLDFLPDVMADEHVRLALGLTKDQWERHITRANKRGSGYTLPTQIPVKPRRFLKDDVRDWMRSGGLRLRVRRSA